jgi:hypothetical protein
MRLAIGEREYIIDPLQKFNAMQVVAHRYPQVEADYIESNLLGDKIGNIYRDGGYLIYRLWPERKVLIDPRYFPFKSWIEDYFKFALVETDMVAYLNSMKADYWLINYKNIKLFEWFNNSKDWELAFFGPVGGIFVPKEKFNGNTRFSSEISRIRSADQLARVLNAVIVLNNPDVARAIHRFAVSNIDSNLLYKNNLINEIDSITQAMVALQNKDYEKSAQLYADTQFVSFGKVLSAKIYRFLATKAWHEEDYIHAREWSIAAYDAELHKTFPDIYNVALTDWHVRHGAYSDSKIIDDKVQWKEKVDFIIDNKNLIAEDMWFIVNIAIAMKNGRYDGKAKLFQQQVLNKKKDSSFKGHE